MKLSISFKEILSRAFQVTRLERTSVLFWCFVFRSSRCLIYKVHAAFAAGLYFTTFRGACQALFFNLFRSFRSAQLVCVLRELIYFTRSLNSRQELFSRFSELFVTLELVLSDANLFILANSRAFVKHFFSDLRDFLLVIVLFLCLSQSAQIIYQIKPTLSILFIYSIRQQ